MPGFFELYQMRQRVEEACRAFRSLDYELAKISRNLNDDASVEAALEQMEAAVERKAAPFFAQYLFVLSPRGHRPRLQSRASFQTSAIVTPANAGVQRKCAIRMACAFPFDWIPACAGMTAERRRAAR